MQRILSQLNHIYIFPLLLINSIFFSCVYFNTFYNSETSYKKALQIIEESPILNKDEVPTQAKKLLGEAMENSQLVLQKYPESKYIDDAVYIIARASFLRNETAIAKSYFKQLIRDYPESEFRSLSEIWLAYTYLRMGMIDTARIQIKSIQDGSPRGNENLYLIHNILAEIAIEEDSTESIYSHYEQASEFAPTKSKQTSTYGKLVKIAEDHEDKERASKYLVRLANVAPDNIRIDSRMKWITYQRELGNYDEIISEIQRMLGMSEFESEYMRLGLELGKVYMDSGNLSLAKEFFGQLTENYSKKNETAEAYYHMGYMALMEDFNLDLAREYFESSKTDKSSSTYGKESKELLNKISRYEALQNMYKDAIKNPGEEIEYNQSDFEYIEDEVQKEHKGDEDNMLDMDKTDEAKDDSQERSRDYNNDMDFDVGARLGNMDFASQMEESSSSSFGTSPDSILFMISEILLYDFEHHELSLDNLKILAEEYPESKFASHALYVLSHYEPDEDWHFQLETNHPNSVFLNSDSLQIDVSPLTQLEIKRDFAWSLTEKSYKESYEEFERLYYEDDDTLSAYISAFISDYYLHDMERTVKHYLAFSDSFPEHLYFPQVDNRLKIIKTDLEIQKTISQQGIDYHNAVYFLRQKQDFDSVNFMLTTIATGENSHYKDAANHLKTVIRNYQELSEEIQKQFAPTKEDSVDQMMAIPMPTIESGTDSLIYLLAELFAKELEFKDSAVYYHQELVSSYRNSRFWPYSIMSLAELEPISSWLDTLQVAYPDTTFAPDSTIYHSAYNEEIYQDKFLSSKEQTIQLCDTYLELFPELIDSSLFFLDTTITVDDSLVIPRDTISIIVDSLMVPTDTLLLVPDTTSSMIPDRKRTIEP